MSKVVFVGPMLIWESTGSCVAQFVAIITLGLMNFVVKRVLMQYYKISMEEGALKLWRAIDMYT